MASTEAAESIWDLVTAVLSHLHKLRYPNLLLWGPPSTGKTHAAAFTGVPRDKPMYSVTLTNDTAAYELRGSLHPLSNKMRDGVVTIAMRAGARLVLNEIHRASGDTVAFLLSVLDDPRLASVTLPTGEVVKPANGFEVVATSNAPPSELDEALASRFPVQIEIQHTHPAAIAALPADLQAAAQGMCDTHDDHRITIRAWEAFAVLRTCIGIHQAAQSVFGPQATDVERSLRLAAAGAE